MATPTGGTNRQRGPMTNWRSWLLISIAFIASARGATEAPFSPQNLSSLVFQQNIGAQLSLQTAFVDDYGHQVHLNDCVGPGPTIITLGYYKCPMLCSLVLNGIVHSLQEIRPGWSGEPNVVFVSVDPDEGPDLASAKKQTYVKRFGRNGAGERWHFLTGSREDIRRIADEIGF